MIIDEPRSNKRNFSTNPNLSNTDFRLSFKDPSGSVFRRGNRILRPLTEDGRRVWTTLQSAPFFNTYIKEGRLIPTQEAAGEPPITLEHPLIPFISYSYEWPASMLRDAALLQLSILADIIPMGFILKDAPSFNVQFMGTRPLFIDPMSFDRHQEGDAWAGYGEFCDSLLNPLLLFTHKGIPYHPWLRGGLGRIPIEECASVFSLPDYLKSGVFVHILLRSLLHKKVTRPDQLSRRELQSVGIPKDVLLKNIKSLRKTIENLKWPQLGKGGWSSYMESECPYTDKERGLKNEKISRVLSGLKPQLLWDFGCNTGEYSEIASRYSDLVVAFDSDHGTIERCVQNLREKRISNVLPLVMDLANPTPNQGWNFRERFSLLARGTPQAVLALAVGHHLAVKARIPLDEQLTFLASLSPLTIFEYVDKSDANFKRISTNTGVEYPDYNRESMDHLARKLFKKVEKTDITPTRTLYILER
ncbi:MAG: hypothetical protein KCHDKBKB_02630 [Elusimicrobia bacterium]|nr:hypothetical protein [Elusimicrobiota bacterium]